MSSNPFHSVLCLLALSFAFATTANATTLVFQGDSNADIPSDYGSHAAADTSGVVTTDGTGATPDIGLFWFPAEDPFANVWEFHNTSNFVSPLESDATSVAQMDVDMSGQDVLPPDPTITFMVPDANRLRINSLDIGQALDQWEPDQFWYISVHQAADDLEVFLHQTPVMGPGDGESVTINFTGMPGVDYYLMFDDDGANTVRGAIDNLSFSQLPADQVGLICDFDGDGQCNADDINMLYANFGAAGGSFDVNNTGAVDAEDISSWLTLASAPENPYLQGAKTFELGDVNLDGSVDSSDLGLLLNNLGDTNGLLFGAGNLNDDPEVNSADLGLLLNNFGFASQQAVPEPSALSLLLTAALAMVGLLRRKAVV